MAVGDLARYDETARIARNHGWSVEIDDVRRAVERRDNGVEPDDMEAWELLALGVLDGLARMKSGVELIAAERERQVEVECWTSEHDAGHDVGELTRAAICYANTGWTAVLRDDAATFDRLARQPWPWSQDAWKPSDDPIRNLVKAGALIAAEIDRLTAKEPHA